MGQSCLDTNLLFSIPYRANLWLTLRPSLSSNLRKVNLLLQALEDAAKDVDYYALDLSQLELERTLAQLPRYRYVRAHGLLGTYDDGQIWLKDPSIASRQKCIMSLGSSVGESFSARTSDGQPD